MEKGFKKLMDIIRERPGLDAPTIYRMLGYKEFRSPRKYTIGNAEKANLIVWKNGWFVKEELA